MSDLPPDFRELLEAFSNAGVEAVLVGGYAVAFHGRPRATKDIDLLLVGSPDNLAAAARALDTFGAPPNVVRATASMQPSEVVFMGEPPLRIDLLRTIDGVETSDVFARAVIADIDGVAIRISSRSKSSRVRSGGRAKRVGRSGRARTWKSLPWKATRSESMSRFRRSTYSSGVICSASLTRLVLARVAVGLLHGREPGGQRVSWRH